MSTSAGPIIGGKPSTITLLSPTELRQYPYLDLLRDMINRGFAAIPGIDTIFPIPVTRLETDTQIFDEIGPDFFTFIISTDASEGQPGTLIATASGRRLLPKDAEGKLLDVLKDLYEVQERLGASEDGAECWELKLIVVDPGVQRQGLAKLLIKLVEGQVVARSSGPRARLMLDCLRDHNERFYLGQGFDVKEHINVAPGKSGVKKSFVSSFMEKSIQVRET